MVVRTTIPHCSQITTRNVLTHVPLRTPYSKQAVRGNYLPPSLTRQRHLVPLHVHLVPVSYVLCRVSCYKWHGVKSWHTNCIPLPHPTTSQIVGSGALQSNTLSSSCRNSSSTLLQPNHPRVPPRAPGSTKHTHELPSETTNAPLVQSISPLARRKSWSS